MKVTIKIEVEAYAGFSRKYSADVRDPKTGLKIISKSIDEIKAKFPEGTEFEVSNEVAAKYTIRRKAK